MDDELRYNCDRYGLRIFRSSFIVYLTYNYNGLIINFINEYRYV